MQIGLALTFAGVLAAAASAKGDALLDKYIEVTAGEAAHAKIHSDMTTGTMEFEAMGLKGKITTYGAEPDKKYSEVLLDGVAAVGGRQRRCGLESPPSATASRKAMKRPRLCCRQNSMPT